MKRRRRAAAAGETEGRRRLTIIVLLLPGNGRLVCFWNAAWPAEGNRAATAQSQWPVAETTTTTQKLHSGQTVCDVTNNFAKRKRE